MYKKFIMGHICSLNFKYLYMSLGDDLGKIWVYDIGEQLAVPQQDEYNKFVNTLQVRGV